MATRQKADTANVAKVKQAGAAVVPTVKGSIALSAANPLTDLFLDHSGEGLENATAQDFALPFLYLLQSLSPQVDESGSGYVEGARPGMFINTVTQELFTNLHVIPCDFEKVVNEWVPRDAGGGFVASYKTRHEAEVSQREGTQLVDTANHYVLVQSEDGSWSPAILSLTSTKLKSSRNWLSRISQRMMTGRNGEKVVAPSFSAVYVVSSVKTKNDKGTFFTTEIKPVEGEEGWVRDPALVEQALDFRAQLKSGRAKADYSKTGEDVTDAVVDDADDEFDKSQARR